ncbi:hypothetical protein [Kitasatospora sp. NPDC005748]|uniref:hypothetical protein n=1 Tax=Kitasatospora sp. NPDC005748 TaxID=3157063 RepID=UPI0033D08534
MAEESLAAHWSSREKTAERLRELIGDKHSARSAPYPVGQRGRQGGADGLPKGRW